MAKGWRGVEKVLNRLDGREWVFACPKSNCFYAVSASSEEDAKQKEIDHECPYIGGVTHIAGSVTVMLVEEMWADADKYYARMENDPSDANKGILNGMCRMIVLFMRPHFSTPADVAKELTKRRAMSQAGEPYETPGLGSRRYEPPKGVADKPLTKVTEGDQVRNLRTHLVGRVLRINETEGIVVEYKEKGSKVSYGVYEHMADLELVPEEPIEKRKTKEPRVFSDQERTAIKFAHESGSFSIEQIASVYDATPRDITAVLKL